MEFLFDKYSYEARLLPALIAFAPLGFAIAAWFPGETATWNWLGTLFISLGLGALLSQLGRDLGKRKEAWLFRQWGGIPTTKLLSRRLSRLDSSTLNRYHSKLQTLLPELEIPTTSDESQNPTAASEVYGTCILFLREKTRDRKRFPLVFSENVNFGFRRNLWALKPFGIPSSIVGIASCSLAVILRGHRTASGLLLAIVGIAIGVLLFVLWLAVFSPNWVRIPADAYAERLLGSLDNL